MTRKIQYLLLRETAKNRLALDIKSRKNLLFYSNFHCSSLARCLISVAKRHVSFVSGTKQNLSEGTVCLLPNANIKSLIIKLWKLLRRRPHSSENYSSEDNVHY